MPFLPLIRQHTLILAGTDDPIIPLINGRLMAALLPHARLHRYDDGTSRCSRLRPSWPQSCHVSCSVRDSDAGENVPG